MQKNYLDLFSGIGGFALGAYWAGKRFDRHFCSDIEAYAVKLYKLRFPDSVQLGDITKIDWYELKRKYPGEWFITGGFPCQDISIAGEGEGFYDEDGNPTRSGLWFTMQEAIRILRPKFVIAENVGALTFRGLDAVLASLAEIGYDVEWQDIRASDVGAPHKRERIWIVAYPGCEHGTGRPDERESTRQTRPRNAIESQRSAEGDRLSVASDSDRSGGRTSADGADANRSAENQERRLITFDESCRHDTTLADSGISRLQRGQQQNGGERTQPNDQQSLRCNRSWDEHWLEVATRLCRVDDGVSRRVDRLKGLGNAVVPYIPMTLWLLCPDD